jgi:HAD superfamily hydrolase (TIGR01490 family)
MVHILDIDDTVIRKSSTWHFLLEAMKDGLIRFSQVRSLPFELVKYKLGRPDTDFIEKAVTRLAGIERNALRRIAVSCFEHRIKPNIYTEAARLIRGAQQRGEKVIFATSSLHGIVRPLENFFGIEGSIAADLEFRDGMTTGRLIGNSFFGPKKKAAVAEWLERNGLSAEEVCFYSDSYTDIPLLEICGRPFAVNPDRTLTREAKKRGWEIMRFKEVGVSSLKTTN